MRRGKETEENLKRNLNSISEFCPLKLLQLKLFVKLFEEKLKRSLISISEFRPLRLFQPQLFVI